MPPTPITVIFLTNNPNRGSTSRPTEGWFTYLREKGLRPVLVSHSSGNFQEWVRKRDIPCYEIALGHPNKFWPFPFLISLWKLRAVAKKHEAELIHCMEQDVYPSGKFLSKITKIPVVVTAQFTLNRSFSEWAFGSSPKPSRLFFVSKGNQATSKSAVDGLVDESKWRILYNSVDTEEFKPEEEINLTFRKKYNLEGEVLVGTASALRPRKQIEHMIEAMSILEKRNVTNFKFVIAGGPVAGDEQYAKELIENAKALFGDRFVALGHQEDLSGLYNALDIYLHTSKEEGCSLSILEAMATGCPVLGYESVAADEQVLPDGGEIVEQNNAEKLADVIEKWVTDEPLRIKTKELARQRVIDGFNSKTTSYYLWSEYQSLLGKA